MFPRPRCFWTIDAPAVHPQRMESFGGDLEHRLLALRIRCWWASPGPSFVAGGSGAQEYRAIAAVRPPSLNCSETRRRDHARLGRRSDANARRGWRNRVPAETGFCFGRCYAALSLGARPKMAAAAVKSPVSARKRTCGGGHSVADGKEVCC